MSYYYKYDFISPESIYATVKEELKSYFDTGAINDLMFPTYLDKCLKKLGRSSYIIVPEILYIEDFEARLPDNFYAAREAWLCTEIPQSAYQSANSFYSQTSDQTTIQVIPITYNGIECSNINCTNGCTECTPENIQSVYKTNTNRTRSFKQSYLLKPGNISAKSLCSVEYTNNLNTYSQNNINENFTPNSSGLDSFDIRDNKFVTNFRNGIVHLLFYATDFDEIGNQLVPDNYRIREYIEKFIKYKMFETLTNQTNDETFNQLQQKLVRAEQVSDEAFIMASIEIKKQTVNQKVNRIKKDLNRFNMYKLPNGSNSYRRNG